MGEIVTSHPSSPHDASVPAWQLGKRVDRAWVRCEEAA